MMSENDGRVFRNHGREISPKPAMFEHFKLCLLYLSHAAAISVATKTVLPQLEMEKAFFR
jgi:hypothetical protein